MRPTASRLVALLVGLMILGGCALVPADSRLAALPATIADGLTGPTLAPPATAAPTLGPTGESDVAGLRLRPRPRKGAFRMDLYRRGDHVRQFTSSWCVGASMQMMINIIEGGRPDRSRRTQKDLYDLAREVSPWEERRPGASTYGWAGGLTELGHGPYGELSAPGKQEALRIAARQMRYTRKPVGLLVWRGRHAWVMSGFRATADPAYTDDFEVTHVYIEDPWAGRDSPAWGRGLSAHSLVPVDRLRGFTRWSSHHRPEYGREGHYVIVAP
ncbi:MAG: hypothetical protein ABWZ82_04660, partial [Candidatus Limnocylindrales bacterium]